MKLLKEEREYNIFLIEFIYLNSRKKTWFFRNYSLTEKCTNVNTDNIHLMINNVPYQ
jgi:hypothetical protein